MLSSPPSRARVTSWAAYALLFAPLACGGGQPCSGCHGLGGGDTADVPVWSDPQPATAGSWSTSSDLSYTLTLADGTSVQLPGETDNQDQIDLASGELRVSSVYSPAGDAGPAAGVAAWHLRALLVWPAQAAASEGAHDVAIALTLCANHDAWLTETEPRTCTTGDAEELTVQAKLTHEIVRTDDAGNPLPPGEPPRDSFDLSIQTSRFTLLANDGWTYHAGSPATAGHYTCEYATK